MTARTKFGVRLHQSGLGYEELRRIFVEADRLGYRSATLYILPALGASEAAALTRKLVQ